MKYVIRKGWAVAALAALSVAGLHADPEEVIAVSSRVAKDYVRQRSSDGSFQPERYVFGEGGYIEGSARDAGTAKMTFLGVAHTIAPPLAAQKYFPSRDPANTKLLIMVYWGTTQIGDSPQDMDGYNEIAAAKAITVTPLPHMSGTAHFDSQSGMAPVSMPELAAPDTNAAFGLAGAENEIRDQQDWRNARLLGYDSWWDSTSDDLAAGPGAVAQRQVMIGELEDERYFVVLQAFDWQKLYRAKQHKMLWETRFSIRSRGRDFSKDLTAMVQNASRYFGRSSDGLVHEVPEGHVWVGEPKPITVSDSGAGK